MIGTILRRELKEVVRGRWFHVLTLLMFALLLAAALDGWNRYLADQQVRSDAVITDREVWVEQGENNPHGAAHFARYAFREVPPLAAFDPGVYDYAGAAFSMEAHNRNPTTLRRVEDAAVQSPFPSISPGWIILVMGTLLIATVLFPAVAVERERGTLRALAASGVTAREFTAGKMGSLAVLVVGLALLAIVVAVAPSLLGMSDSSPPARRVLALFVVYLLGLLCFAFVILWISARAKSSGEAFSGAAVAWLFFALICQVFAGQLALTLYPDLDEQTLKNEIQLKAQTPFWAGNAKDAAVAAEEKKILDEFGAASFDALGFDRQALILQAHEEFANAVYDELYGALHLRQVGQDKVLRYATLLSPVLAVQRLSAGISGTDQLAQLQFAVQAEQHRRQIIAQLNRDMMIHGGGQGFAYIADRDLWEAIPDFEASPPSLGRVFNYYWFEVFVLMLWLLAAGYFALRATGAALRRGI